MFMHPSLVSGDTWDISMRARRFNARRQKARTLLRRLALDRGEVGQLESRRQLLVVGDLGDDG